MIIIDWRLGYRQDPEYVFLESIFLLLDQILSLETCLGAYAS